MSDECGNQEVNNEKEPTTYYAAMQALKKQRDESVFLLARLQETQKEFEWMKTQFNSQFDQLRVSQEALVEARKATDFPNQTVTAELEKLRAENARLLAACEAGTEAVREARQTIRDLETANGYSQRKWNEVILQRRQIRLALKLAQNILRDE